MIHILFSQSAYGTLNFALRGKSDKIIAFPNFFGEGPVNNLLSEEGLQQRAQWLAEAFKLDANAYESDFTSALHKLQQITENERVIIWTCENAAEQFGLRFVCHYLSNKNCEMFICNTYFNMLQLNTNPEIRYEVRHSGEIIAERMKWMLERNMLEPVSEQMLTKYKKEANKVMQGHSKIRTWLDGAIVEGPETRDDDMLIHYAKELQANSTDREFLKAPRLIGEVLGWSPHDINDTWIEYRLQTLIRKGIFAFEGDLTNMRKYQVKLLTDEMNL